MTEYERERSQVCEGGSPDNEADSDRPAVEVVIPTAEQLTPDGTAREKPPTIGSGPPAYVAFEPLFAILHLSLEALSYALLLRSVRHGGGWWREEGSEAGYTSLLREAASYGPQGLWL
jgi:hypothetical protein